MPLVLLILCTKELHKLMHYITLNFCIKSVSISQFKIPVLSTIFETAPFLLYRVKLLNITHLLKMPNHFSTSFYLQFESGLNVPFLLLFPQMQLQRALQKTFGKICIFLNILLGPPFEFFCTSLIAIHIRALHQKTLESSLDDSCCLLIQ